MADLRASGIVALVVLDGPVTGEVFRANEALWTTVGELLDHFPAEECQNDLSNCGYEFT